MTTSPLAHLDDNGREHLLLDHLQSVAELAREYARAFGGGEQAALAGLWHDLGKYAGDFQDMLREAHPEGAANAHLERDDGAAKRRVDHSTAGAFLAATRDRQNALPIVFAIAGHHAGLADLKQLSERLKGRGEARLAAASKTAPPDLLDRAVPALAARLVPASMRDLDAYRRVELFTRMVFSALCDADFLDTEAFFDGKKATLRGGHLSLDELSARLTRHIDELSRGDTEVNRVRGEVRAACRAAASGAPGVYTLTVPTGGGKTLAAMEFALDHARRHDLRRVVVAIPYTSIIEQNAKVYRTAFGLGDDDASVVEHHSATDPERETAKNRLASENWDAPVVVTTNVQLLESLFARRSGACRKLHRLARSVVVLDEAQTLPRGLLAPTTDVLEALARDYGATIVLCTATQPALSRQVLGDCGFTETSEIVPEPQQLAMRLSRVEVDWSAAAAPVEWTTLAERIAQEPDILAIVHRRADARVLAEAVDAVTGDRSTVHLSALMVPEHRAVVLANVIADKRAGKAVRLVATQLVEAGVDLDFPVVYRALAGIDSLTQAAGRCNREGKLAGKGALRVFLAPTSPPKGILEQGLAHTQAMLRAGPVDLFAPATHAAYFERLYRAGDGARDEKGIQGHRAKLNFETVAAAYRVVDDDWSAPLVVSYEGKADDVLKAVRQIGPSRERMRKLQRFTIQVPKHLRDGWVRAGLVEVIADTVHVLLNRSAYDERFGLRADVIDTLAPASSVV